MPELASDYLEAMQAGPWPTEVIVIDNGDAPKLPGCRIIEAGENLGFARASNLGLRAATSDYVTFANNDVALLRSGWLSEIHAALEPGVLVGPMRWDAHATVDGVPMPYIDGWCLSGLRSDLLELGGFDEQLEEPAYFSDNVICLEARASGLTLREVTVGLHHKESATSRPSVNPEVRRVTLANQVRYQARARELLATA